MQQPWDFLDGYRGKRFSGEWPTIPEMFLLTVERHPRRRCFTGFEPQPLSFSYAEAAQAVARIAGHLSARGVKAGDRVVLTGKNSPEWALAYLAILATGAVVVPIDYQLHVAQIQHLVEFAEARLVIADEEKFDSLEAPGAGSLGKLSLSPARPGYVLQLEGEWQGPGPREGDLAAILFTSGTTGNEKGVMLTHHNLVSDTYLSQANLTVLTSDVFYALMPIHHSYTMTAVLLEALSVGAQVVFGKRLVTQQILKELKAGQVTMFLGVPMLFNRLLKGIKKGVREKGMLAYVLIRTLMAISGLIKKVLKVNPGKRLLHSVVAKVSLDHIRICISGGGPLAPSTFRQFNQMGIDFVQGYGLTETSPIVTLNPTDHYKETSVGRVIPRVEMKIVGADEKGVGEVAIRGPMVMKGYFRNGAATREVLTPDGFLLTGDMGYLDGEDYLYLTGRKKSMIVTEGGKNVYPEEIENCFQLYDEIEQVLIRGYIDDPETRSEKIEAVFYPAPDFFENSPLKGDPEGIHRRIGEVVEEVNRALHPYQKISRFQLIDEPMEMTTTKKIKRHKVAQRSAEAI